MNVTPRSSSNGFKVEHVRQAALDVGISAAYVTLALDEVLRRGDALPMPAFASPAAVAPPQTRGSVGAELRAQVRTLSSPSSALAGAPMTLIYEAEVQGQLSPNDFDVIAQTIRNMVGEAGLATALGRTLTWTLGGAQNQRRMHVSVTAAGGRTTIRAEERMGPSAAATFGGIVGGAGGGMGSASVGVTMGAMHNPALAVGVLAFLLGTAYTVARGIFTSTVRSRARLLEKLVATLAAQSTALIEEDGTRKVIR
jgi:hypothetical protein